MKCLNKTNTASTLQIELLLPRNVLFQKYRDEAVFDVISWNEPIV